MASRIVSKIKELNAPDNIISERGHTPTTKGVGRNWGHFEPKNDCNWD